MSGKYGVWRVAPRIHHRRLIRIYFFPWILLYCTILLALFSLHIGTDWRVIGVIWSVFCLSFLLKDLTSPYSVLARYYYHIATKFGYYNPHTQERASANIVYLNYDPPPLFPHRGFIRWSLYLWILFVINGYAIYQSQYPATATLIERAIVTFLILLYSLLVYIRFLSMPVDLSNGYRIVIWGAVILGKVATIVVCLYALHAEQVLITSLAIYLFLVLLSLFAAQRLWADSYVQMEIMGELTKDLMTWPQLQHNLNGAAARIGNDLGYGRVFILTANTDHSQLAVTDQFGVNRSLYGQEIPYEDSICGRAFREKTTIIWNDVRNCPYFFAVPNDDTRAEMAIPIMHQNIIYGILDIQSTQPDIFGPRDKEALEAVAQTLGTALAANRSNTFFDEALEIWQRIDEATNMQFSSEEQALEMFADFALSMLKADLVIYYPLSLADVPTSEPYIRGERCNLEPILSPGSDPTHPLVCMIKKWQSIFRERVDPNFASFIVSEEIQSTCFVPVGLATERLGALLLNYRQPRQFDKAFQFTCLSLVQGLAKVVAQVRYREILFQSFGRPEMSLHNILGRHALKEGVIQRARTVWPRCGIDCCDTIEECELYPIFDDIEDFLTEISLVESSIPPNFWQENMKARLQDFLSNLPHQKNGRRPQIQLQVDAKMERENAWVKLAFYRIATEAVNNAVLHGKATAIRISMVRGSTQLELLIENNGRPLPVEAQASASSNGIFHLLNEMRTKFGADVAEIRPKTPESGAVVVVSLSALPLVTLHC